jgi:ATP-dependent Lon protease
MQESAQAALSYIRSRAKEIGLKDNFYSDLDIHIHLPEGAIPKDGPSAGIGLATVLTSALTNIPLLSNVALTGEVTLRGRVLPVGGLKEKLLAAARSGITKAIVPKENQSDIKEFLNELDSSLKIFYAESMDEVLNEALAKSPFVAAPKKAVTTKSATTKVAKKVTPKSKSKVKK